MNNNWNLFQKYLNKILNRSFLYFQDRSKLRQYSPSNLHNAFVAAKDTGMSVHEVSIVYNIPFTTLRDRVDGGINFYTVKSESPPMFTQEEDARLVNHIKEMLDHGYGYSCAEIIRMASDYAVSSLKPPKEQLLINQWYCNFMGRWKDLSLIKSKI